MDTHEVRKPPIIEARIGGVLYLIIIVGGLMGEAFVRGSRIVAGDAQATAERIHASLPLWRASVAGELFMLVCTVVLALIFYVLLRPISRDLALLVVFFNLVSVVIEVTYELSLLAPLALLSNAEYLQVFSTEQLAALAQIPLESYAFGFAGSLIFFGAECLLLGYLIYRSGFLPGVVGVLMLAAGLSYLTNSFALVLSPSLAGRLYPAILLPAFVGEASLCLWLLLKGVNASKWSAQAETAAAPGTLSGAPA